jgi:mono/diheme cytochrome c family protein
MWKISGCLGLIAALAACSPESPFGFRLPEGDAAAGRQAYVDLRCNSCHEVRGIAIEYREGLAHVPLGGVTTRVKTYGELVTSIINPSHRIAPPNRVDGVLPDGQSVMSAAYLNDVMTVQQLIDLVAFLQPTYEAVPPPPPMQWYVYP